MGGHQRQGTRLVARATPRSRLPPSQRPSLSYGRVGSRGQRSRYTRSELGQVRRCPGKRRPGGRDGLHRDPEDFATMNNRSRQIEFLVIGGGPAGSAAALELAKRGREVLVVERSDNRTPRVGETLPSAMNPILARLGLNTEPVPFGQLRCPGTVSIWGSDIPYFNDSLFDPDGDGVHLDRASFDAALVRRAEAAGA